MICTLKEKILIDLFCYKDKNLEELFSNSIQNIDEKKSKMHKNKQNFRKNEISQIKNNQLIIEEISRYINKKDIALYKPLTPENTKLSSGDKSYKIHNGSSINSNNLIELNSDEKFESKDILTSYNYTCSTSEVKNNKFNENDAKNDVLDKEKIIHIFKEIKDKYFQKKENNISISDNLNRKVYAHSLDKNQIYYLFAKYFEEKINNSQ